MNFVILGLGSNLGSPFQQLSSALISIAKIPEVTKCISSSCYESTPVSSIPQNDYLNAACLCFTNLSLNEFFLKSQEIEQLLGKVNKSKEEARLIDIDILFFNDCIIETPLLTIPHDKWFLRLFVLQPLKDLLPFIPNSQIKTNIAKAFKEFRNTNQEKIFPFKQKLPYTLYK